MEKRVRNIAEHYTSLYAYLDALEVWGQGAEAVAQAKADYWRSYKAKWRRENRKTNIDISVAFKKSDATCIQTEAKRHGLSSTEFIRKAVLSYFTRRYIVPDKRQLAHMEIRLAETVSRIRQVATAKDRDYWQREDRYQRLEKEVSHLKELVTDTLTFPKLLREAVAREVQTNTEFTKWLQNLLEQGDYDR